MTNIVNPSDTSSDVPRPLHPGAAAMAPHPLDIQDDDTIDGTPDVVFSTIMERLSGNPRLQAIAQTCVNNHDLGVQLIEAIQAAEIEKQNGPLSPEMKQKLVHQTKLVIASISILRGQNRKLQHMVRKSKAETAEARQEVDTLLLQLSNALYEKAHLESEIEAIESYHHKYTELDMIPEEEFLALHPELADANENDLMVARIEHERMEREKLEAQRLELVKIKQKLIADNKKRREDLADLDTKLEKFIDGGQPIQKLLEKEV